MTQTPTRKPIAIGTDHRGVPLKDRLKAWLQANGYAVTDCGADAGDGRVDAMDYAVRLAGEIGAGRSDFAVGICGSGQMMAITANRFPFIRATLLHMVDEALGARRHGDANMLVLGADALDGAVAEEMLKVFLETAAEGGRYGERRERLARLDVSKLPGGAG
ncbi:MAG: RpiB/LacA/LacB family sugar-phosphate isomerase [Hyphomonas sp.]|nr:RpiB/LacA/LacB family sugar-phosphate isomerase [Hyphomonas sp.]